VQPGAYNDGSLGILQQPGAYNSGSLGVFAQPGAYRDGTLGMLRTAASVQPQQSPAARAMAAAAARAAARAQCFGSCYRLPGAQSAACVKRCSATHPLSDDTSNATGVWSFVLLAVGIAGLSYVAITAS